MRAAACLTLVLTGCSPLLGIQDPSSRDHDAGVDAASDAASEGHLELSTGNRKLAKRQTLSFRVELVGPSSRRDVTAEATYTTDHEDLVTFGAKGTVIGTATGTAMVTASMPNAEPASLQVTVSTFACHPVINEFTTGTNARGADDEFVEIYNPCADDANVEGWTLNYRGPNAGSASPDSHALVVLAGTLSPGAFRVYAGATYPGPSVSQWPVSFGMGQTDGALGLRSGPSDTGTGTPGTLVDSVAYGTPVASNPFIEVKAMTEMANGASASRLPYDGRDDDANGTRDGDNSVDFKISTHPTPGAANLP